MVSDSGALQIATATLLFIVGLGYFILQLCVRVLNSRIE